jgi:vanillate O-demethylase ferredoxin subunit
MLQSWMSLRVAKKWREATDIHCFELVDPEGRDLPPFTAGAHLDVELKPGLVRQYSLCNDPRRRDAYQLAVMREPASRGGSNILIDEIRQGDELRVSEPGNHFTLEPSARHTVLVAGGIGITPVLCMAERLAHAGQPFELHYAARSPERAAFVERIRASAFADRTRFYFSQGGDRLDLAAILYKPPSGAHLYVCGPPRLIEATLATAKAQGWPPSRVHREFFTPPEDTHGPAGAFQIRLASSGQVLDVPADRSITEVLAENGIVLPTSCEQGVCGTCLTRVLEGEIDHRDVFLTEAEQAVGDQMTPCCSRSKSPLLVLDL